MNLVTHHKIKLNSIGCFFMLKQMAAPAATLLVGLLFEVCFKLNDLLIYIVRLISSLLNKINRFKLYLARFANLLIDTSVFNKYILIYIYICICVALAKFSWL